VEEETVNVVSVGSRGGASWSFEIYSHILS